MIDVPDEGPTEPPEPTEQTALVSVICFDCRREMTVDTSIGATVAVCAICALRLRRYPPLDCARDLRELVDRAWDPARTGPLTLSPSALPEPGSDAALNAIVEVILAHVRATCPRLPEVRAAAPARYAPLGHFGLFSTDSAGFATILIDEALRDHYAATCTVLCHEVMHQVLSVAGLVLPERLPDELRTDRMMFVAGLGQVVLRGHRKHRALPEAPGNPEIGGYHTHTERLALEDWVRARWQRPTSAQDDRTMKLYRRLLGRYRTPAQVAVRIQQVRRLHPGRPDPWIYEWLLSTR